MTQLAEGQVWVATAYEGTTLEVRYQILALWGDWVWVYIYGARSRYKKKPETWPRDYFEGTTFRLRYDVPLSIS